MNDHLAETTSSRDGSTEPQVIQAHIQREAAKIRELWKTRNWHDRKQHDIDSQCLHRHKSLVLNLAIEEFDQVSGRSSQSISLEKYCQRYAGLGESIENSIFHQLEVKKYLNENPDLLNLDNQFSWPEPEGTFQNFRVLEELGRGALARVYLCEQMHLGRRSAVVKIELGKSKYEPSLLGKLRHPNIIALHWADYDAETGASYLCMPFHGRSTLIDLLRLAFHSGVPDRSNVILEAAGLWLKDSDEYLMESTISSPDLFRKSGSYVEGIILLASQVADSLSYAHSQHVIHGDVKPSNVLLTPSGVPLLFDFNLGRDKGEHDGPAGGTLTYMAPEQLRTLSSRNSGDFPVAEISTDIYAFGVLFYELLTGKPPFEIPTHLSEKEEIASALVEMQRNGCPDLRKLNPEVDRKLADLVKSCLAYDAQSRPATMHAVHRQLVQHAGQLAAGRRYTRNHPLRVGLWCIIAAGVVAGSASVYLLQPSLLERAAAAEKARNYQHAVGYLDQVLADEPHLVSARLDRARMNLELGTYEAAALDLEWLVQTTIDPTVFAYYGFCLNLMNKHEAAIEWYRRAIKNGLSTPGIRNNLGVSLILHRDLASQDQRLVEASAALNQALLERPESFIIRLNALRNTCLLLERNQEIDVDEAVENSLWLREAQPTSAIVWKTSFLFYNFLANKKIVDRSAAYLCLQRAVQLRANISRDQLEQLLLYAAYRSQPGFESLLEVATFAEEKLPSAKLAPSTRFLNPLTADRIAD